MFRDSPWPIVRLRGHLCFSPRPLPVRSISVSEWGSGGEGRTISKIKKLNSSGRHGDFSLYLITDISVMRGCHGPYPQRGAFFTFCERIVLMINAFCGYFASDTV